MPPGSQSSVTVGIDIGTTAVKGLAVSGDGSVVARTRIPHDLIVPAPSRFEHDAVRSWWDAPRRALADLAGSDPVAVAVSALAPSMTGVDGDGRPLGPGLLFGDDRARPDGRADVRDPSGSGEAAGMLAWATGRYPEAVAYGPAQMVANRALGAGEVAVDLGTAVACGTLLGAGDWDAETARRAGTTPDRLPAIRMLGEAIGEADGVVVGAGGVDGLCEQLVAGADEPGDVLVVCGGTVVVWAVVPEELGDVPAGCWRVPHWRGGAALLGGASSAGGVWLDWVDRLLRPADGATADPGAVPVLTPHLRGERVPLHDPDRRGEMRGLDLTQGPAELRRAAFEASAFAARHVLDATGVTPRRIVATGGGSRVKGWMQALADATGSAVTAVAVPEGGALGAAFLARVAAGLEPDMTGAPAWSRPGRTYEPDPQWTVATSERYRSYRELVS